MVWSDTEVRLYLCHHFPCIDGHAVQDRHVPLDHDRRNTDLLPCTEVVGTAAGTGLYAQRMAQENDLWHTGYLFSVTGPDPLPLPALSRSSLLDRGGLPVLLAGDADGKERHRLLLCGRPGHTATGRSKEFTVSHGITGADDGDAARHDPSIRTLFTRYIPGER